MRYIRNGWQSTKDQFPVVIILFLYQLLWGVFLYRLINSAIIPLLQRYPDPAPSELSRILFLIESQLELKYSSEVHLYFWLLAGMFILRMLLTPLIQAGILYGLRPLTPDGAGLVFFQGIGRLWKPVTVFYLIELILVLGPAYWLGPKLLDLLVQGIQTGGYPLLYTAIYILGWLIYGYLIHQLLLYAKFGYIFGKGMLSSILSCLRRLLIVTGISLFLGGVALLLFGAFSTASWIWTGFLALILQQSYPFIRTLLNIWHIASQYHLWNEKN